MQDLVDCLVVGAGPTGLMMAAELARYGLSCRVIDKALKPSDKSKALAIQSRTLEIFDHLGIVKKILDEGLKVESFSPSSNGRLITTISFSHLKATYPFILSLEQSRTEAILEGHLAHYGVRPERGTELVSFSQNENEVQALVKNNQSGKQETIRASWMIGCDGPHSTVRKQLGMKFEGEEFEDVFALADVTIDWKYPHNQGLAFLDPSGTLAVIPMPGDRQYRVIYLSGEMPDLAIVTAKIREKADKEAFLSLPLWMANFRIHSRMVDSYQERRIFLAGDAAHIHSPVGGQGMNTGIQDAFNLAWKLAFVHKKKVDASLIDSYSLERHAVGKAILEGTKIATWMVTLRLPFLVSLRNVIARFITKIPAVQTKLLTVVSQLAINYPKSKWIGKGGGKRAPNATLYFEGKKTTLFDLWRGSMNYKLLIIDESPCSFTKRATERFDDLIDIYEIMPNHDPEHDVRSHYGKGLVLIRPDGYIASSGKEIF